MTATTNAAFISRAHFAKAMGVSIATLNRGRKNGLYPFDRCVKLNKRALYPASLLTDLEASVKAGVENRGSVV